MEKIRFPEIYLEKIRIWGWQQGNEAIRMRSTNLDSQTKIQ